MTRALRQGLTFDVELPVFVEPTNPDYYKYVTVSLDGIDSNFQSIHLRLTTENIEQINTKLREIRK